MGAFSRLQSDVENIKTLPNQPTLEQGYTPSAIKALFDKAGVDIKAYLNDTLIGELESVVLGESGADKIGSGEIAGVAGNSVQQKLISLKNSIAEVVNSVIPDGYISADKFAADIAAFIQFGSLREQSYTAPGTYSFAPTRGGRYKITVIGAGGGGGISSGLTNGEGGKSGAACIGFLSLEAGVIYTLTVGDGGNGLSAHESTGALLSAATEGGESFFARDDEKLMRAPGGSPGGSLLFPLAVGGTVNLRSNGAAPSGVGTNAYGASVLVFRNGGSSILGQGGIAGYAAGIGAGGYGGDVSNPGSYLSGKKGGNGLVMIEYIS